MSVPTGLDPRHQFITTAVQQLRDLGKTYVQRNWSRATSSNYSVVLERDPLRLLITASGKHKEQLAAEDFVVVDQEGSPILDGAPKSSAETMLHVALAEEPEIGAVLHTHSIWSTLLSDHYFTSGELEISGFEMLKGLEGIQTHTSRVAVRIFDNTQDITQLAGEVRELRAAGADNLTHGLLLRGHGLYTWGQDFWSAKRHVEALEFLFEVMGRQLSLPSKP